MDHVRGNCNRDKCKYFHPTAHQHIQLQTRQTLSPSATATAAPHALLAKRVALEPTGVAGGLFNCGTLSFQQTVSPTPLQTATALLPTVPMMLGAPAVPAISPYVTAASANASQIILK
ncbi:muscleblind-like protein 1 [Sinocyclocheilus grahami]|uniref:muscleblind-like protein 1 n=1 Tax=Sinocyclocheilus grahami TaxID=75366 RepID=UPI0007ACB7A3|nr:PREDICTED: muscleblind-like protein 1 [Sinocyclocheilus grahami]